MTHWLRSCDLKEKKNDMTTRMENDKPYFNVPN